MILRWDYDWFAIWISRIMPELCEVQIMADNLQEWLQGQKIVHWAVIDSKLHNVDFAQLHNLPIQKVYRMAKWMALDFGEKTLLCHCRMTGQWIQEDAQHQYCRLLCTTEKGRSYQFVDPRRFGILEIIDSNQIEAFKKNKNLGAEIWPHLRTGSWFAKKFQPFKGNIKQSLLRQDIVVGIGNILACELLYQAQISPFVTIQSVQHKDWEAFAQAVPIVIQRILDAERSEKIAFLHEGAEIPQAFRVYGRGNQTCQICHQLIQSIQQQGRVTYYCENCQFVEAS